MNKTVILIAALCALMAFYLVQIERELDAALYILHEVEKCPTCPAVTSADILPASQWESGV